ncbi:MAG: hypothetical protein FWG65_06620 [Turicibacter sp.]|nr:hypothetical protein [Turicibacter sp.]
MLKMSKLQITSSNSMEGRKTMKTSTRILAIGLAFVLFIGPSALAADTQYNNDNQYTLQEQRRQRLEQLEQFRVDNVITRANRAEIGEQMSEEERLQHRQQFRLYVADFDEETLISRLGLSEIAREPFLLGLSQYTEIIFHITAEPLREYLLARSPHVSPEDLPFPPAPRTGDDAHLFPFISELFTDYAIDTGLMTFEEQFRRVPGTDMSGLSFVPDAYSMAMLARYVELVTPQSFFQYHVEAANRAAEAEAALDNE